MPRPEQEYSYVDYLTWNEAERWEILDGMAYMQAAPSRIHQEILGELYLQFGSYLKGKPCKVYPAPFCVRLDVEKNDYDVKNVVEPDQKIVSVFTLQPNGRYGRPEMYTMEDKIKVSLFPDLEIDLQSVFGKA